MVKSATGRFEALDSLRGICALLVALFHLKSSGFIGQTGFIRNAWLFVDFFFVLSGFVIAASYGERLRNGYSVGKFMLLRLGRVYPLHLFMLGVFAAFETVKLLLGPTGLSQKVPWQSPNSPGELVQSLAMVHIFGIEDHLVWNVPSWSIAAEAWTYLVMAVLLALTGARSRLIIPAIPVIGLVLLLALGAPYLDRTHSFALVRCLAGFALGMMAFDLHGRIAARRTGQGGTAAELAILAAVVAFVSLVDAANPANLLAPLLFMVAVLVFALEAGTVSRWLMRPFALLLGALSYSIYMIHTFIEARAIDVALVLAGKTGLPLASIQPDGDGGVVKMLGTPQLPVMGDIMSVPVLVAIVIGSWFTYRFVETPCREYVRARVSARQPSIGPV